MAAMNGDLAAPTLERGLEQGPAAGPLISRRPHLAETVVLVDGICRAGKGLMGPLLSSLERVEIERMEEIMEHLGVLHRLGKLSRDAAAALLNIQADMFLYNNLIARNTNFRFTDHSGVWSGPRPLRYLRRLRAPEGAPQVLERIHREQPILQNMTHDQLMNLPLFAAAFGPRLRVVEMVRHPADLAASWLRRGWGTRFGEDPWALTFCIRHGERDVPYYAVGWEETYLAATPLGRVIRMIAWVWDENERTYAALPQAQRAQIRFVPYEGLIQQPLPHLEAVAAFLGTRTTAATPRFVRRKGLPRPVRASERQARWARVQADATPEERAILERLAADYERVVRERCGAEAMD